MQRKLKKKLNLIHEVFLYYFFHSKGVLLRPFSKVTRRNGEPVRAVLISWFFVQVKLFFRILVTVQSHPCQKDWHVYSKKREFFFSGELFLYILSLSVPNELIRVTYGEHSLLYLYQRNIFYIMLFSFFRSASDLRFWYT